MTRQAKQHLRIPEFVGPEYDPVAAHQPYQLATTISRWKSLRASQDEFKDAPEHQRAMRVAAHHVTEARMALALHRTNDYGRGGRPSPSVRKRVAQAVRALLGAIDSGDMGALRVTCACEGMYLHALLAANKTRLRHGAALAIRVLNAYQTHRDRLQGRWQRVPVWSYIDADIPADASLLISGLYLHVSEEDPMKVAYTPSVQYLLQDRQVRTTFGRFLTKYFGPEGEIPCLTHAQIKLAAERWASRNQAIDPREVQFIENDDPDGWVAVYDDGPDSCMQGEDAVRVYARPGNGLRLAWLERDDTPVARAIVREDTTPPQYVRVYPNLDGDAEARQLHTQFTAVLKKMGYVHGTLLGVKLAYIETERYSNTIVMPYVDRGVGGPPRGTIEADERGMYVLVGEEGYVSLTETSGVVSVGTECGHCGDRDHEDNMTYVDHADDYVCDHCLGEHYVHAVVDRRGYGDFVPFEEAIYCESTERYYTHRAAEDLDILECAYSNKWYELDDLTECSVGRYVNEYVRTEDTETDHVTNEIGCVDEFHNTDDGPVFRDYLVTCCITGANRHEAYMMRVVTGSLYEHASTTAVYVDVENVSVEDFVQAFHISGTVGARGKLLQRTQFDLYQREISAQDADHEPLNVQFGDECTTTWAELVEQIAEHQSSTPDTQAVAA